MENGEKEEAIRAPEPSSRDWYGLKEISGDSLDFLFEIGRPTIRPLPPLKEGISIRPVIIGRIDKQGGKKREIRFGLKSLRKKEELSEIPHDWQSKEEEGESRTIITTTKAEIPEEVSNKDALLIAYAILGAYQEISEGVGWED